MEPSATSGGETVGRNKDKGKGRINESLDTSHQLDESIQSESNSGEEMKDIRSKIHDGKGFQLVTTK